MTEQPSDATVLSTVPLTHEGKDIPVGTDMTQLGLEKHQLKTLLELGEADYSNRRGRARRS